MLLRLLNRLEETIIATLLAGATIIVLAAVVQRYGLSAAAGIMNWAKAAGYDGLAAAARSAIFAITSVRLTWAQELTIFMIIWMAKFGAAYGVRTGIHVGVDIITSRLTGRRKTALVLFGLGAGALFTAIVGYLGTHFVAHLYHTGHSAAVLEVPMWIVYLAVPLGSFLMCFRFLEAAWVFVKTGEIAQHDPGSVMGLEHEREGRP